MLKPLVPKFPLDLSGPLKDIAEKQIPAKQKPIVVGTTVYELSHKVCLAALRHCLFCVLCSFFALCF